MADSKYTFEDLTDIVKTLRSEHGCPWDRVQTHQSLKINTIEEAYEVVEAIDDYSETGNADNLKEELGDLLFQVVFHSRIAQENGCFNIDDVTDRISEKMIYRHPHVFGKKQYTDVKEQQADWDMLKKQEHKESDDPQVVLSSIPSSFPALLRAQKIIKKSYKMGIIKDTEEDRFKELINNISALKDLSLNSTAQAEEDEFQSYLGKALFSLVKIAADHDFTAETVLLDELNSFIRQIQ